MLQQAQSYQSTSQNLVAALKNLTSELDADKSNFDTIVQNLNSAVGGDNGVLATLNAQISQVDSQIHNDEIGMITSGAGIAGAIFTIFIAAFLDVFTAGAATGIIIGASCALVTSAIGEATAAGLYASALNTKQTLLFEQNQLTAEVKTANGICAGYQSLAIRVGSAAEAAEAMTNAWSNLTADLSGYITDLSNGTMSSDDIKELFVTAAENDIPEIINDCNEIKSQMDNVSIVNNGKNKSIADVVSDYLS